MPMRTLGGVMVALALVGPWPAGLWAQTFRRGSVELNALRPVVIPPGTAYSIVVTEFFHHGEIRPDGKNVGVAVKNRDWVPTRVLQVGPGDFCRVAFQTVRGQMDYEVLYGGQPVAKDLPSWTSRDGLLLETREYTDCNLLRFEEVRKAFEAAKPIGSDYVEQVRHAHNPMRPRPGPFFSHYSGYLLVSSPANYGFWTSSQDCSFLLIDDNLVASAPGRHGALYRARPADRQDVRLASGLHKFDYYHAATGPGTVALAAWETDFSQGRSRPEAIPAEAFHSQMIGRVPAGRLALRTARLTPDFTVRIAGEVPLPDNPLPLLGALFRDATPRPLSQEGKFHWDFGDGQTSHYRDADHVYLHPGEYAVKLTVKHSGRTYEMVNRVAVDSPVLGPKDKLHTLDEYLVVLDGYDPRTLDAVALRQLAMAYEAKCLALDAKAEDEQKLAEANADRLSEAAKAAQRADRAAGFRSPGLKYLAKAVAVVVTAMEADTSAAQGDDDLVRLARLVGPMARDRLGDSLSAQKVWQGVAGRVAHPALRAECELELADLAINDLGTPAAAKTALESAAGHLGGAKSGPAAAKLQRLLGDYAAATGKGKNAQDAYRAAEQILGATGDYARRSARRGAFGRSTEEHLRAGRYERAVAEIRQWQAEFPTDKIDGYLTLLYARYWSGRKQYPQAVAQAEQLQAVNADSPYLDQALYLAADCELKRGHPERALAILHGLAKDHPGSPLIPVVKKAIAQLEPAGKP